MAWLTCLPLVVLATASNGAAAQDLVAAKILSLTGPVEIRRGPSGGAAMLKKINFRPDDQLKVGDQILTGWRGRLVLGMTDGSQAVIGERTVVEVRDLGNSPRELFHILRGKARVYIEKLGGRPNPYRINTPTAVIAVRGTLFDVIVKTSETEVFVHEGVVAVNSLNQPEQMVLLTAGQMTRVRGDQSPSLPMRFKPGRNDDAFREVDTRREILGLQSESIEERTLRNPSTVMPSGRQGSSSPSAAGGQRGPARRP